eukprot:g39208.t1
MGIAWANQEVLADRYKQEIQEVSSVYRLAFLHLARAHEWTKTAIPQLPAQFLIFVPDMADQENVAPLFVDKHLQFLLDGM